MKRFLMCLVATLMTTIAFAGNYDTIFVKPNTDFTFDLNVNTDKHPSLEGKKVIWYRGIADVNAIDITATPKETVASKLTNIITYRGQEAVQTEGEETKADNLNGPIFYGYNIVVTTKADAAQGQLSVTDVKDMICDTVVFIHVLKELTNESFGEFSVGDAKTPNSTHTIKLGDSIDIKMLPKEGVEILDIQKYLLVSLSEDGKDTTVIAESLTPEFKIAPTESYERVFPMFENEIGKVLPKTTYAKTITVLPEFKVISIGYSTVTMEESFSKTSEGVETIDVNVLNHDSVALFVNTNKDDSKVEFTTSWNKDGLAITAEGVKVKDKTTLTFSEFVKPEMEGTYNCIISDKDGNPLKTVSFIVSAQFPTANETIGVNVTPMRVSNKVLYLDGVEGVVRVFNMRGGLVKTIKAHGGTSQVSLDLPNGVYIITNDSNKIKVSI